MREILTTTHQLITRGTEVRFQWVPAGARLPLGQREGGQSSKKRNQDSRLLVGDDENRPGRRIRGAKQAGSGRRSSTQWPRPRSRTIPFPPAGQESSSLECRPT